MKKIFQILIAILIGWHSVIAQDIILEIEIDNSDSLNSNVFGFNGAFSLRYGIDKSTNTIPNEIVEAIADMGNSILRFPGGTLVNDYHFNNLGYGGIRTEHEQYRLRSNCDTINGEFDDYYCFKQDAAAIRNYAYDFVDLAKELNRKRGGKTKVMYVINLLTHFVNSNQNQLRKLDQVNTISDLEMLANNGAIPNGLKDGILENLGALQLFLDEDGIEIAGIEFGNELFWLPVLTGNQLSEGPLNSNMPGIKALLKCYNRLINIKDSTIKKGIPTAKYDSRGNATRFEKFWNEKIRNEIIDEVDAIIIHDFIKVKGNDFFPNLAEETDYLDKMDENLSKMYAKYLQVGDKVKFNSDFFDIVNKNKEIWITEYNVSNNSDFENPSKGLWLHWWRNSFLHGAYMMEHSLNFWNASKDYNVTKILAHNLLGGPDAYRYGCISVFEDMSIRKRVQYYPLQMIQHLNDWTLRKVSTSDASAELDDYLFHTYTYFGKHNEASIDCNGSAFIFFINTSGTPVNIDYSDLKITTNSIEETVINAEINYMSAPHLYSTNGRTNYFLEEVEDEVLQTKTTLEAEQTYEIPGFAFGYIKLDLDSADCTPILTSLYANKNQSITTYPNPVREYLNFKLENQGNEILFISIYNQLGELLMYEPLEGNKVDVELLINGFYYYKVHSLDNPTTFFTGRFAKQ